MSFYFIQTTLVVLLKLTLVVFLYRDAFYMNCELLSQPGLADRPACVGSGMILTSNYKARYVQRARTDNDFDEFSESLLTPLLLM